ncbi:UDP-N-acetylmuramate--L-alanine ligase [Rhodothalassium salexigens]|uniref:UDP-N-acetylmuramate--L-alanine ligase n=1 Tax=Rhodothalassium salexigens TaxID=1086 RepID=UPI001911ACBB|nr:UDP-N-acetylmuramate--L-alanine ligase [Rhodothalassium salexigens]MBK5911708.1 UDP-N-acetylmuramate--L-alanine ligase [Rhodothalassium salexigens]
MNGVDAQRTLPFDIGTVHFTGIGGIGMSGIAEVMHNLGYAVQGSDIKENAVIERLKSLGIEVFIGQRAENVARASVLVVSTAIRPDNPEVVAAREAKLPVVRRADMLAELMRLKWCVSVGGTHGKTTTTSMVASVLEAADYDPTVINGGIINAYGTNARLGGGDWMVVEADESDGSFLRLPATFAVVTNMDPEHLDFYGDFDALRLAFQEFAERVPFYGAAILCTDHPEVQTLFGRIADRRAIAYGFNPQADVRGVNMRFEGGGASFDVDLTDRVDGTARSLTGFRLPMPGRHNVQNALAAIAVGLAMGIGDDRLRAAFLGFEGVKRRFTHVGTGAGRVVIDDYGHHPVEISAVLAAARQAYEGRVVAVVQPHRYSRLAALFDDFCTCFNNADHVIVAPVFAAGETAMAGVSADTLAAGLKRYGHRSVATVSGPDALAEAVLSASGPGDVVICLGAGDITRWAAALPRALDALDPHAREVRS